MRVNDLGVDPEYKDRAVISPLIIRAPLFHCEPAANGSCLGFHNCESGPHSIAKLMELTDSPTVPGPLVNEKGSNYRIGKISENPLLIIRSGH